MYEFLDRRVTTLDQGGRFLIWSMRSWATAAGHNHKQGSLPRQMQCPASVIAPAFAKWRMISGLQPFHRLMLLLSRHALETIQFNNLPCHHVAEHEAILISLICGLGEGQPEAAAGTLALIVEEDRRDEVLQAMCELTAAMAAASILPGRLTPTPDSIGKRS